MSLCKHCNSEIPLGLRNRGAAYCSTKCRTRHYNFRVGMKGLGLPTGTTGAISELRVAADLLLKGYEVFRAMSANCSCDLAILRNNQLLRVEVSTGYINGITGKLQKNKPDISEKFDLLAIVVNDKIIYMPEKF